MIKKFLLLLLVVALLVAVKGCFRKCNSANPRQGCPGPFIDVVYPPKENNCIMLTKLLVVLLQLLSMWLSATSCALRQPKPKTCFPCNYKEVIVQSWNQNKHSTNTHRLDQYNCTCIGIKTQ